ncbi:hypothetical protein [Embleya sp. NPDC059259]|uniref:hypothetical protein n=1 Tax=unclassified Embleya TaxID=2699296 RepID=UPI0036CF7D68
MRVIRLDRDLVGIADIAERTKRTRQNVTQWTHGTRHSKQPFPSPDGVVGCSRVWLWSEVNTWLRTIDLGDPIELPSREEMAAIDYALAFPRQDLGLTLELHIAADEHERERHEVARRLMAKAVALAGRISDDDTYDGGPVLVVCAVCSDSLAWVMSQLPLGGKLAVVAVSVGDDGDVWELGLSAVPLPGGVPLEQAGLDCHASVGDLVRAHSSGRLDRQTVLEM